MKIAIISDTHFGSSWGTPREQDSFTQAQEAFETASKLGAKLILLAGDVFDSRVPKPEVWARAMRILSQPLAHNNETEAKIVSLLGKNEEQISPIVLKRIPVVAIHGTHERRSKQLSNPLQVLESGGFLIHLHCNGVVLEIDGNRVAIQGMSGVPENYALDVLKKWDPQPLKMMDSLNVLIFHQALEGFVYSNPETGVLTVEDLPKGFDFYVDGHVHAHGVEDKNGKKLVFPGSTVATQLTKQEAETHKGFYLYDTEKKEFEFHPLSTARKIIYIEIESPDQKSLQKTISDAVKKHDGGKKPLVRVKILGEKKQELNLAELSEEFEEKAIISFVDKQDSQKLGDMIQLLRQEHSEKHGLREKGLQILQECLSEYDPSFVANIFEDLVEGKNQELFTTLSHGVEKKPETQQVLTPTKEKTTLEQKIETSGKEKKKDFVFFEV